MLEMMANKSSPKVVEIYGPGPQTLMYGDMNYGYFGKVTEAQMGIGKSIADNMTFTTKYFTDTPTNEYGKFARKGLILYVPYFTFGTSTPGAAHDRKMNYNPTGPANQIPVFPILSGRGAYAVNFKAKTKSGATMLVRLATMADGVNYVQFTSTANPPTPGEFVDLFIKPFSTTLPGPPVGPDPWPNPWKLPAADIAKAYMAATVSETISATMTHDKDRAYSIKIGPDPAGAGNPRYNKVNLAAATSVCLWLPVIQFVPEDEVPNLPA